MPAKPKPSPKKLPKDHQVIDLKIVKVTRAASADGGETGPKTFRITLATETPVQRYFGLEVLSCQKSAVDLTRTKRGIPFFQEHGGIYLDNPDPNLRVGLATNLELVNNELECDVQFSPTVRGQEAEAEMEGGFTPYLSVGYVRSKMKQTKTGNPNTGEPDEFLVTRWRPVEGSVVAFPADPNATVQRSADAEQFAVEIEETETVPPAEEPNMKKVRNEQGAVVEVADDDPRPALEPAAVIETRSAGPGGAPPAGATEVERNKAARVRAAEIVRMCDANGMQTRAAEFIESELNADQVAREILNLRSSPARPAQPAAETINGLPVKDRRKFSYTRALRNAVAVIAGTGGRYDGVEGEVHQEFERQVEGTGYERRGGFFIPLTRRTAEEETQRQTRAMGTNVSGQGAELVFDRPGELIDILRNRSIFFQAGANSMPGLTGPVPLPKQTGDPTVYWMGENPAAAAAASGLTFGTVILAPKTMIGTVPFPRQLLNMASVDIEGRIRLSLAAKSAVELDRTGFHGLGVGGEPMGVYNLPGIKTVSFGGVPVYGKMVDLGSQIADANADTDVMRYVTTPLMAGKLKQTLRASAAGSDMIWEGTYRDGEVSGYTAQATKNVRSNMGGGSDEHGIIFGDFSTVDIGMWGALEFIPDIVTLADKGLIKITTFQMVDIAFTRIESFAVATGAKIA